MSTTLTLDWPEPVACEELSGAYRHPFHDRDGVYEEHIEDRPTPANERNMCALSAVLRSKPQWWTKYTDPVIRARWKSEAVGAPVPYGEIPLKEDEVDYVLDELAHYAAMRDPVTGVEASIAVRIWQSDTLVDDELRDELLTCVGKLEDVPDELKDWHPRANGQVLDLVHPSLYPGIYGRTLISSETLPPREVPRPEYAVNPSSVIVPYADGHRLTRDFHDSTSVNPSFISRRFQWLPTDFAISADGTSAHALGYINNLEPRIHANTYLVIERLVARFVPLWERVLGETAAGYFPPVRTKDDYEKNYLREATQEEDENGEEPPCVITLPGLRVPKFEGHSAPPVVTLKGRTLQVIVKLSNIHLTPEKPEYPGGSWHVEGMINEAIVSTGIYYYDEENVTESRLAFRTAVDEPTYAEQDDHIGSTTTYGFDRDEPLVQMIGAVVTKAGRCIAFPNMYQHQVQPFSLADSSRPGHRKILALFLVDPSLEHPRPSTTFVPPQQREWMYATIHALAASPESGLSRLPVELLDAIVDHNDGLMDRSEAEALRLELMDERSAMTSEVTEQVFTLPFNMCEH
ncbi:hypothetical protein PENSPDRAFT_753199 [Peniophora sp. CONT]|nr:hypothetical protein PENSPDRAFT_753199 [Peniophora sp. CONT]